MTEAVPQSQPQPAYDPTVIGWLNRARKATGQDWIIEQHVDDAVWNVSPLGVEAGLFPPKVPLGRVCHYKLMIRGQEPVTLAGDKRDANWEYPDPPRSPFRFSNRRNILNFLMGLVQGAEAVRNASRPVEE